LSGEKCGTVQISAEELARREAERLARAAREAEQREHERRERMWAELAAARADIDRARRELTSLGSPAEAASATGLSKDTRIDPAPLLALALAERSALQARVRNRRRDLEIAVSAVNADIAAIATQVEQIRRSQIAAGESPSIDIALPTAMSSRVDERTVSGIEGSRSALRSSVASLDAALVSLADTRSAIAIAPLRQALNKAAPKENVAESVAPLNAKDLVPLELRNQANVLDDWAPTASVRGVLEEASSAPSSVGAEVAVRSARAMLQSLVGLRERHQELVVKLASALRDASAGVHESDLASIEVVFAPLVARVANVKQSRTIEDASESLEALDSSIDSELKAVAQSAATVRGRAEADRQASAFVQALRTAGFAPVVNAAATIRIPRGGQLGPIGSADSDERHLVRRFAHVDDPSKQVALLQSLDEPGRISTITGDGAEGLSLPALVKRVTSSTEPDPEWVETVCETALPDAEAILRDYGYAFTYAPWSPRVETEAKETDASQQDDEHGTSRNSQAR